MLKVFLARYKNIITLIWCVGVFLYFKIAHNFQFKNGSSIIFLLLILVLPLGLNIYYNVVRHRTKKLKKAHQGNFFDQIKYDFLSKEVNRPLLNHLYQMNRNTKVEDKGDEITIATGSDTYLFITFTSKFCKISMENTEIVYYLYYERVVFDTTSYDQKGFKYYATDNIYQAILKIVKNLKRERLFYQELRQHNKLLQIRLLDRTDDQVIYEKNLHRKNIFGGEVTLFERRIII